MRGVICLAVLAAAMGSAVAKECRMPDLPANAQVAIPPECRDSVRVKDSQAGQERLKANSGFIDLGQGTQVRIGGRVRGEMGAQR